jgi:hypothetical protein
MEILNVVKVAVGNVDVSLLSGSAPLVDSDFIVQENPPRRLKILIFL